MKSTSVLRLSAAAFIMAALPLPAAAQNFDSLTNGLTDTLQNAIDLLPDDVTNVRLGLGPVMGTDYEGSDHYRVSAVPAISLRYRNILEINNNEVKVTAFRRLFAGSTGALSSNLSAGPLVRIDFGRDETDSPDLRGMGDVNIALELGAFVAYTFEHGARLRLRARHDVIDGHGGGLVIADYTQPFIRTSRFVLGGIAAGTFASGAYMRSYFGVSPAQSLTSGYAVHRPGAGFKDVNFGLNSNYQISPQWSIASTVNYKRLLGGAADSPIVRQVGSSNQLSLSAFVVYAF
jgi:outer membrane protein